MFKASSIPRIRQINGSKQKLMITKEYRELIDKIILRTSEGKIKWETTSDKNKFLCRISLKTIVVHSYVYYNQESDSNLQSISFEILDLMGEKIDGIYVDESEPDYIKMTDLYDMTRRNALNIDRTIRDLLDALE